jgi:hypothetical protein
MLKVGDRCIQTMYEDYGDKPCIIIRIEKIYNKYDVGHRHENKRVIDHVSGLLLRDLEKVFKVIETKSKWDLSHVKKYKVAIFLESLK